jgi:hypothetical protein
MVLISKEIVFLKKQKINIGNGLNIFLENFQRRLFVKYSFPTLPHLHILSSPTEIPLAIVLVVMSKSTRVVYTNKIGCIAFHGELSAKMFKKLLQLLLYLLKWLILS